MRDTRDDEGEGGLGTLFFAPDQMIARTREWDRGEFRDRFAAALDDFAGWTTAWLRLVRASGADAVDAAYYRTRRGQVAPTDGVILSLHPTRPA